MASQMANFLDQAGGLWLKGALHGKVGGAFTSTATQHGGQETTLFSVITNRPRKNCMADAMRAAFSSVNAAPFVQGAICKSRHRFCVRSRP
jgi:multimeric flavodoxin WrbA